MIKYIKGDLFSNKTDSLAHCVSADQKMGAGIAVEFKKRWSMEISNSFMAEFTFTGKIKVGSCVFTNLGLGFGKGIFNLVTKERYFNKPTLKTIKNSIKDMFKIARTRNIYTIAMPKIGCGLDKLKWKDVSEIIERYQKDINIVVYELMGNS